MADSDALEREIRAFLRDELRLDAEHITRDAGLVTTGLIDSADLVRLATHVERHVGIAVPDGDITADHFDSIAKILAYVEGRGGA
jgi:acyl carrier protein